jgi:2-C-methyl-D-erythritol 4-phosphate cytidylyltransferase
VENYVIIVAGGSGQRMLSEIPKQFLTIAEKPVLLYSLETFAEAIPDIIIILVLPEKHFEIWEKIIKEQNVSIKHSLVAGGETRSQSVLNGLKLITGSGLVAIHDGVRPIITPELIRNLFSRASLFGSAIPAIPVTDTVRQIQGDQSVLIDRNQLRLVQTPQVFKSDILHKAYEKYGSGSYTDDATAVEKSGFKIHLCEGDPQNIKLTNPLDILIAEAILRQRL